jgi:hypothetical protein
MVLLDRLVRLAVALVLATALAASLALPHLGVLPEPRERGSTFVPAQVYGNAEPPPNPGPLMGDLKNEPVPFGGWCEKTIATVVRVHYACSEEPPKVPTVSN